MTLCVMQVLKDVVSNIYSEYVGKRWEGLRKICHLRYERWLFMVLARSRVGSSDLLLKCHTRLLLAFLPVSKCIGHERLPPAALSPDMPLADYIYTRSNVLSTGPW